MEQHILLVAPSEHNFFASKFASCKAVYSLLESFCSTYIMVVSFESCNCGLLNDVSCSQ